MTLDNLISKTPSYLLSERVIEDLLLWKKSIAPLKTQINQLDKLLFPEQLDFYYDSSSDSRNRKKGISPMTQEYQNRINEKRTLWQATPYDIGLDNGSLEFCRKLVLAEGNYIHYDFIGDIHGYAKDLRLLLSNLGYVEKDGFYQAEFRKAYFVGDFVDRGLEIVDTLEIVKAMCDNGSAKAVMGNHEFNWIMFNTIGYNGKPIREHSSSKLDQNEETRAQFNLIPQKKRDELNSWIMDLPFWIEEDEFRVVHACWETDSMDRIRKRFPSLKFTSIKDVKYLSHKYTVVPGDLKNKAEQLYNDLSKILTGIEYKLPVGLYFTDTNHHQRTDVRVKWWKLPASKNSKDLFFNFDEINDTQPLEKIKVEYPDFKTSTTKPLFIGHYWLKGLPSIMSESVVCVDYSIAKEGELIAYSTGDFQQKLSNKNFQTK